MTRKQVLKDNGKYLGQCRTHFNALEQWDGKNWVEPPEVGVYEGTPSKIHFDVEDALYTQDDSVDHVFKPRGVK